MFLDEETSANIKPISRCFTNLLSYLERTMIEQLCLILVYCITSFYTTTLLKFSKA